MAWGHGTTVADAASYAGTRGNQGAGFDQGIKDFLNNLKNVDNITFYLEDDNIGATYENYPLSANINVGPEGRANWGAQVVGGGGLLSGAAGISGQGTSGSLSRWGSVSTQPIPGLTFSLGGQKNPGMNFNLWGPSVNYQNQWATPWGNLGVNVGKSHGQDARGMVTLSGGTLGRD